jgi:hypothetical protein
VAVASLGAAVATKASQAALDATNTTVATKASQSGLDALSVNLNTVATSLNNQYSTVSSLLGTRASQTSVTAALALKQDLIEDGSLSIAKTGGLQDTLDYERAIRVGIQGQIAGTAASLGYTQQDLADLTSVVAGKASAANLLTKQDTLDGASSVTVGTLQATTGGVSGDLTVGGGVDISGTTTANQITASTITATNVTATVGAFGQFSSNLIGDNGSTLYVAYGGAYAIRFGKYSARIGINCDNGASSGVAIECVGAARFSGPVTASNFPSTSDARLNKLVQVADPSECLRILKAVRPRTYSRIDMNDAPRCGYIAQELSAELTGNYRCIIGESQDDQGSLLSVDYSRLVPVLHAALLAALARIEALESRIQ